MNTKHTPGPWYVGGENMNSLTVRRPGPTGTFEGSGTICLMGRVGYENDGNGIRPGSELKANARLIAAAPELLALVLELLDPEKATCFMSAIELDSSLDGEKWEQRARAVVAKAEGR